MGTTNESLGGRHTLPKSTRHKQILHVAAEQPDASLETIADQVTTATPELVENVLEEYGDPGTAGDADTTQDASSDTAEWTSDESVEPTTDEPDETLSDPDDLTDSQRQTLRLISEQPEATQRELGEQLGVTAATVSKRVSAIDGIDWDNRSERAEAIFSDNGATPANETTDMSSNDNEPPATHEHLDEQDGTAEQSVPVHGSPADDGLFLSEPELIQKVLHACLRSETITEEEELEILKGLLG